VPYFTAVLAHRGEEWDLVSADLEDAADLEDVALAVRTAVRGGTGLAVIEREDEWFALVRVDDDEDPRVFVSDLAAAGAGSFGGVFVDVDPSSGGAVADRGFDGEVVADDDQEESGRAVAEDTAAVTRDADAQSVVGSAWGGDATLLEDLGIGSEDLVSIVDRAPDPGGALLEVAKRTGFTDLVESWR
jgi:putative tRNA adenosine deaminase-associated protein